MTITDLFTNSEYILMKLIQKWRTARVKNSDFSSFYQKNWNRVGILSRRIYLESITVPPCARSIINHEFVRFTLGIEF